MIFKDRSSHFIISIINLICQVDLFDSVTSEAIAKFCQLIKGGELQGRGIVRLYVVTIVAYQDYQDRCRPHKRRNWIFTHVAHAHNIEVH